MTTSLPPDYALYHMDAKVFQRSKGRSSVAAAAYRSASCLTDHRIGQTFDYTKKHKVASFILTPADAPAWTQNREQLWNACEAVERSNGVVGREVELSIPRDIPETEWQAFAEEIVAPYIEAGAVVDVAIHAPTAADKNPNPHIHGMMTTRALDAARPHGFASKKNDALTRIFESGGRHGGGKRGDALKAERERIADIANRYLAAAGSPRRVTHKSWVDLGVAREPEPDMGEERIKKVRRQGKHDRKTALVSSMRNARILENELAAVEESVMSENPKFQNMNGIAPRRRQDYKSKLFAEKFPDAEFKDLADQLYQVDTKNPRLTKIRMRDGGWCEVDEAGRTVKVYGSHGAADQLAQRVVDADYADHISRLEVTQQFQKAGTKARKAVPADEAEAIADRWKERGYTKVETMPDGVWITVGNTRIQDLGDTLRVHGHPSDAAVRAMVEKAVEEWDSSMEVFGSTEFKDAIWLEAQRHGATVYDKTTGELYEPSPDVRAKFEADRKRVAKESDDMNDLQANKKVSALLKSAAAGDAEAATRLENNDAELYGFLNIHLDEDQRKSLAREPDEKVITALSAFRELGAKALEGEEKKAEDKRVVSLSQRLAAKAERDREMEAGHGNVPAPQ